MSSQLEDVGDIEEHQLATDTASSKKKKKKSKKKRYPVPEPPPLLPPDVPVLKISRNKHWKYVSSYHVCHPSHRRGF